MVLATVAGLAVGALGCGGSDHSAPSTTTTAPRETVQKLPKLPNGWNARKDKSIGYAIGVAPGWSFKSHGRRALIRSPDHLVAVTLTADRAGDALALAPGRFASRALAALPGFRARLKAGKVTSFNGTPLRAVQTSANGVTSNGRIPERATVIVLRRDQLVNYTVAVLANRKQSASRLDRSFAFRMVRTLRDQPVEKRSSRGSP